MTLEGFLRIFEFLPKNRQNLESHPKGNLHLVKKISSKISKSRLNKTSSIFDQSTRKKFRIRFKVCSSSFTKKSLKMFTLKSSKGYHNLGRVVFGVFVEMSWALAHTFISLSA